MTEMTNRAREHQAKASHPGLLHVTNTLAGNVSLRLMIFRPKRELGFRSSS